ncbi:MAG: YeeE/YedE family protein [Casimicrobiaceae bacterium]|nr:YeeE/YedE family protein [Casimicrobiaceae bacterium]MCX8099467.1 YeeE/YedE family protein [Casimicrobiaceae bacterium]MDW8312504.1 YeeE/YedE family protein [Burkholderiales bacterium]
MSIDWGSFTPIAALVGGVLIGLSAVIYALGVGRIAGIAGILGGLLQGATAGDRIRWGFVLGLIVAPWLWKAFADMPPTATDVGLPLVILAGLLVGIGVRMGNGCTSGHGVCGLSRFSLRSLVNVLAFMGAGFVTVFVLRHILSIGG